MKKLLLLIILLLNVNIMSSQENYKDNDIIKVIIDSQEYKTKYKPGFSYYDNRGCKCTLIKWVDVGMGFRWKTKFEWLGVTCYGWTDDCWIDVYTKKAFVNERTHQIVYYDSVTITPIKHDNK